MKLKHVVFVATTAFVMMPQISGAQQPNSCANASQRKPNYTESQCNELQAHIKEYCNRPRDCNGSGLDRATLSRRASDGLNCKGALEGGADAFKTPDSSQKKAISDATALLNECRRKYDEAGSKR
jgi:hypothetical protein